MATIKLVSYDYMQNQRFLPTKEQMCAKEDLNCAAFSKNMQRKSSGRLLMNW